MGDVQLPQAHLDHVARRLSALETLQVQLGNSVDQVATVTDATRGDLLRLATEFAEFRRLNELAKNLQLAQTKIIHVNQELDTTFGHHAEVRRHATGILQALDVGVVTRETMYEVSEELMLSTPRYWLAPALVALAAWIGDDRHLAERALGEALGRDDDKVTLFYALTLRRYGRGPAANRWLEQYLARQDPGAMSNELTTVLDAMATGALGVEARPLVRVSMDGWFEQMTADRTVVEAQISRWTQLLDARRGGPEPQLEILPSVSPTWPDLEEQFRRATVHRNAHDHFRGLFSRPAQDEPDLRVKVDTILQNLVTNFDDDEQPLRREAHRLQLIIDHDGDTTAAADAHELYAPIQQDTVDFLTLVSNAAFYPDQVGASRSTQLVSIAMAQEWIAQADGRLEADGHRDLPDGVDLEIEGWSGRVDASATEAGLATSLRKHIDAETERAVAAVRVPAGAIGSAVAAALFLVFAISSGASGSAGGLVFCLLVAIALGGYAGYAFGQLPARRATVRRQGAARRAQALGVLKGAIAETIDWQTAWRREMAFAPAFQQFVRGLDRDAFVVAAPDHRREVMI